MLFIILLALLAGGWIFKYPDVLQAEVTLTTEEPPAFISVSYTHLGVGVSFLLLLKQGKVQSEYTDKICSLFKQGDCNSVLESDAAKLWGMFSWSEIGLGYFISSLTLVVFYPQWMPYLMLVNLLSLPYTGWSVWYPVSYTHLIWDYLAIPCWYGINIVILFTVFQKKEKKLLLYGVNGVNG